MLRQSNDTSGFTKKNPELKNTIHHDLLSARCANAWGWGPYTLDLPPPGCNRHQDDMTFLGSKIPNETVIGGATKRACGILGPGGPGRSN